MYSEVLFAEEEPPYAGKKSRGADWRDYETNQGRWRRVITPVL